MTKLKLQYSGHLMQRAKSLEKTLMLGKIEGRRKRLIFCVIEGVFTLRGVWPSKTARVISQHFTSTVCV